VISQFHIPAALSLGKDHLSGLNLKLGGIRAGLVTVAKREWSLFDLCHEWNRGHSTRSLVITLA